MADPDPARRAAAQRLLPGARLFDDPLAAVAAEPLDVVDIAVPPNEQPGVIRRVLDQELEDLLMAARGACR